MEIRSNNKAKHRSQKFAFGIFRLLSLCIVLILFAILGFIIYKGIGAISWDFITSAPTDGMTGGGIWPAIVGTFYLMVGSALFAFPIGVMSGIYMNEYAPKGRLVRFIRVMTNNLSGIPSIVFGLFGMADDMACYFADGYAKHYHRVDSRLGTCFGRDGADSVYLCRIFPAATSYRHFGSVYGLALPFVCDFHQWNGYGGTTAAGLWHGIGIDYDYPVGESAG